MATFRQDVEATIPALRRYARALTRDREIADDLVQDTLVRALRSEHLDDEGLFGGIAQRLQEVTLTYEHRLADGFFVRGEYRRDWSNEPFFTGRTPEGSRRTQDTFTAGLVWWFGNKPGTW